VGLRGIRIQNIVNELNGERIDVVMWSPEISTFIANALSPAQILSVEIKGEGGATVVVPDRQLSLAIGKEGQNVRLAAKITGMRIDIKSASAAELEKAAAQPPVTEEKEEVAVGEEQVAAVAAAAEPIPVVEESTPAEKIAEPVTVTVPGEPEEPGVPPPAVVKPQIRFAEELITPAPARKSEVKPGKKKKKTGRERDEDGVRLRKGRRLQDISMGDEEEEY
jgi:N utilization substance protein A